MSGDRIERDVLIDASRERVWAVLTEAENVARWIGDSAEIDLRPEAKMLYGWTAHNATYGAELRDYPEQAAV